MYALVSRSLTLETYTVTVMFWAVLALWVHATEYMIFTDPFASVAFELPFQVALFATIGSVYFVWMSLYIFGFVGRGSGAGFRLALLGLAARVLGSMVVVLISSSYDGSNYGALSTGAGPVWWGRNLGIVAFGWGITLVAIATAIDLARGRGRPRWMSIVD